MAKATTVQCDDCGKDASEQTGEFAHIYVDRAGVRKQVEWCPSCLKKNAPALAALHEPPPEQV